MALRPPRQTFGEVSVQRWAREKNACALSDSSHGWASFVRRYFFLHPFSFTDFYVQCQDKGQAIIQPALSFCGACETGLRCAVTSSLPDISGLICHQRHIFFLFTLLFLELHSREKRDHDSRPFLCLSQNAVHWLPHCRFLDVEASSDNLMLALAAWVKARHGRITWYLWNVAGSAEKR